MSTRVSEDEDFDYDPIGEEVDQEESPQLSETDQLKSQEKLNEQTKQKNEIPNTVQFFDHLEDKTEEALKTFTQLEYTTYANKNLGSSPGEPMHCVCTEDYQDGVNYACFDDDCINRGTKMECVNGNTSCGDNCANQRFQNKQYALISVIQTEKKGFGVRLEEDIEPDSLVYEYIGEVIDQKSFKKRMVEYDQEGIKHFYFMMLSSDAFIDATKKGSLGRFLNHSCNPNCYVEKWIVDDRFRMGIFAKRKILANEELTFNYNVDRYGANAQPCYCGEANCIGFIGGKTQTESASLLPQSVAEALGSSVEDEQAFILSKKETSTKIEKNENNINVEFVRGLVMRDILKFEINKLMGVLMQSEDLLIVERLLERIEITETPVIQHKLSFAHGYQSMGKVIQRLIANIDSDDDEVRELKTNLILRILNIMLRWPTVSKNHIEKVEIIPIISNLKSQNINEEITYKCQELLQRWSKFEYRQLIKKTDVPSLGNKFLFDERRRVRQQNSSPTRATSHSTGITRSTPETFERTEYYDEADALRDLDPEWTVAKEEATGKYYFYHKATQETSWEKPLAKSAQQSISKTSTISNNGHANNGNGHSSVNDDPSFVHYTDEQKQQYRKRREEEDKKRREERLLRDKQKKESSLFSIIQRAKELDERKKREEEAKIKEAEAYKAKKKEALKRALLKKQKAKAKQSESQSKGDSSASASPGGIEAQWKVFFVGAVPNLLKQYVGEIGKDNVKNCAREITAQLVSKEMKKGRLPPAKLDSEKYKKIKEFTSIHMGKFLEKYRAKGKRRLEGEIASQTPDSKKQHQ